MNINTHSENHTGSKEADNDLQRSRDSIRYERNTYNATVSEPVKTGLARYKESFLLVSTVVTVVVAIVGLVFTMFQFDKTMKAQRHASAEAAVGQFIAQVTELRTQEQLTVARLEASAIDVDKDSRTRIASSIVCTDRRSANHSLLDSFIVSRAQMLIDGEETGKFAGDILRFLTANQYGHYIGRKPCPPGQKVGPRVSVEGLVLVDSKIADANVKDVFLKCLGFDRGVFDSVAFTHGKFQHIVLTDSQLFSVDFSDSWLSSINFANNKLGGNMVFDNATLFGINLSASEAFEASFSFQGARIIHSDLSGVVTSHHVDKSNEEREEFYKNFATELSRAQSLWGSKLDEAVIVKLQELLSEDEYDKLVNVPVASFKKVARPDLNWEWDSECPPQQRRDRRLDLAPGNSLNLARAFF